MTIRAYAAAEAGKAFERYDYDPGALRADEVEIAVETCGICHSDLSMWDNDWQITAYPFVAGHEVVGTIAATGESVRHLRLGQRVGLGWMARSCLVCRQCIGGHHNRCQQVAEGAATIVGRHGGFADKVRCQAAWAFPLPDAVDPASAGPLFCGGITVFAPFVIHAVAPTQRVGVVGIGGLGHLAISIARHWGCEVTAFSTSSDKEPEARTMGAHRFLHTRDADALADAADSFDLLLVTVNVELDWDAYVNTLRPGGVMHIVGAVPSVNVTWLPVIIGEKSIAGSPTGSPGMVIDMLEFCGRHHIAPIIEEFPLSAVNDAMERLRTGSPRYRLVLRNDLAS